MLYEKLNEYQAGGVYPMHMPGHKRNTGLLGSGLPYGIDVTEIHGFDNLHEPQGVLKETAELAAGLYGSDRAFLLINGSTVGILAAIGALTGRGDKILMASNCHVSVFNAASLFGLVPVYITPDTDELTGIALSVDPAVVETALDADDEIRLVVVTSPTYEGVVSDIQSIAEAAHKRGVPVFVDEAHGAHLGFSGRFPENAVREGADVVVMSLHKTLPALTQCSLLHVCGERADVGEITRLLSVLQTTSPSYVLMASIDSCLRLLVSDKDRLFTDYERNLEQFGRDVEGLQNLSFFGVRCGDGYIDWRSEAAEAPICHGKTIEASPRHVFAFDPGKIVIVTNRAAISGFELADILRTEHKIELEKACPNYAVAMTSVCDTTEGFSRLASALIAIDGSVTVGGSREDAKKAVKSKKRSIDV